MVEPPRPIFAPSIFPKINTRHKSKGHALFYHTRQAFSDQWLTLLAAEGFGKFRHVGGESIRANAYLSPQGQNAILRFAYVLLQLFPPRTPRQLLPKRRRSGAKPLNSAAEAGATSGLDFPQGALFHALTPVSWHYRISWCKACAKAVIARNTTMSRCRVLKRFIWRSFMDCSSRSLLQPCRLDFRSHRLAKSPAIIGSNVD
jgi:hypothetical protein